MELSSPICSCIFIGNTFLIILFLNQVGLFWAVIREGSIAMYDYNDEVENIKHYGQPTPPVYNMTSIPNDLPFFLSYGGADALADVKDVKLLLDNLKDHDGDKLVIQYRDDYAHADYVMGQNAIQVVYDPLMAFFRLQ